MTLQQGHQLLELETCRELAQRGRRARGRIVAIHQDDRHALSVARFDGAPQRRDRFGAGASVFARVGIGCDRPTGRAPSRTNVTPSVSEMRRVWR
jgi:hypothetical protein